MITFRYQTFARSLPLDYKVDVYGKVKPFCINMLRFYTDRMNTDERKDSNVLAKVSVAIKDIGQEEEEQY